MSEPRRRGRPRRFDGAVNVRLPASLHDALAREAIRRDVDVSELIREQLRARYYVTQKPAAPQPVRQ